MGETILKTTIKREIGYLYYCAADSEGNIIVCKAKMCRGGRKKK